MVVLDEILYYASISPRVLYRVVSTIDGVYDFSAVPEDPAWKLKREVADLSMEASDDAFRLSRDEAIFLLHLWGGKHDVIDKPDSSHAEVEAVLERASAPPPPPMERRHALLELATLGRKSKEDEAAQEVKVIPPRREERVLGHGPIKERSDILADEPPVTRPTL